MTLNDNLDEPGDPLGVLRSQVLAMIGLTQDQVTDEGISRLSVEAHESRIYQLKIDIAGREESGQVHAIVKQYRESETPDRVSNDACVLRTLYEAGVNVPRILGHSAQERLILMEYAGNATLADLLKDGAVAAEQSWGLVIEALAKLHATLQNVRTDTQTPDWVFTAEERRDWAIRGLQSWCKWLGHEHEIQTFIPFELSLSRMAERLSHPSKNDRIIWGDCNPKNIIVSGSDIRLIDFQLKRSSIMLDLVLLLAFADCPETYLPKATSHPLLEQYWSLQEERFSELGSLADFLAWYDDELLWRILVFGGMLIEKKDARLPCWSGVCQKMLPDMLELLTERIDS